MEHAGTGLHNGQPKRIIYFRPRKTGIHDSHLSKGSIVSEPFICGKAACHLQHNAHVCKQVMPPRWIHGAEKGTIGGEGDSPVERGIHAGEIPVPFPPLPLVHVDLEQFR